MSRALSEQEIVRRESQKLLDLGINPYPAELFEVNVSAKQIKKNYRFKLDYKNIKITGRLMSRRIAVRHLLSYRIVLPYSTVF